MVKFRSIRRVRWSHLTLALTLPLLLCLTQCGTKPSISSEHCGGTACTVNSNCAQPTVLPLCGDSLTASCQSAVHECVWKIKIDSNCVCIEHDVRLCTVSGNPGVQICTANGARTNTSWATCQTTPTCT